MEDDEKKKGPHTAIDDKAHGQNVDPLWEHKILRKINTMNVSKKAMTTHHNKHRQLTERCE
jgi:hypothetical protein